MQDAHTGSEGHDRVLAVVQDNAASLLRLARRHSLCADDAQDAYQRTLEIYLRRLDDIDHATAGSYLRTVVKHEAITIRAQRQRLLGGEEIDFDLLVASEVSSGEERILAFDRVTRAAEALQSCTGDEVAAMVLKADGHSYKEICSATGWSYTKVNRCLAEGRARFLKRYAAIEAGDECRRLEPLLSIVVDGEASPAQMAEVRPHLRNCGACRATVRELTESQPAIQAVVPAAVLVTPELPETSVGLLSRAYELLLGGVQDRLAVAALKAQSAVETVSATKVAAVAASAAAVAGGGAVAFERTLVEPERARAQERAQLSRSSPRRERPREAAAAAPRATFAPAAPREMEPARGRSSRPARLRRSVASRHPRPEFGFEGGERARATRGNGSVRPSVRPASARPRQATSTTSAAGAFARRPRSGANEDFGFER